MASQSGVTTSASAFGSSGQIGIFNSLGGINSGRLNEEDLQNSVHSEFGQDMISQILNDQSHKPRGPSTLIDETVELEADAVQELVAQEIIIKHLNVTQIVASPVNGLLQYPYPVRVPASISAIGKDGSLLSRTTLPVPKPSSTT